jgi:hypothetical protein
MPAAVAVAVVVVAVPAAVVPMVVMPVAMPVVTVMMVAMPVVVMMPVAHLPHQAGIVRDRLRLGHRGCRGYRGEESDGCDCRRRESESSKHLKNLLTCVVLPERSHARQG